MKLKTLAIAVFVAIAAIHCKSFAQITYTNTRVDSLRFASAIGNGCEATGGLSFAGGWNSFAEGNISFAFGNLCMAKEYQSIALGMNAQAYQRHAIAIGYGSISGTYQSIYGQQSIAIGNYAQALNDYSMAFGNYVKVTAQNSIVLGTGASEDEPLVHWKANSLAVGFGGVDPTFYIGESDNSGTGKVGIATTTPGCKLQVNGNMAVGYNDLAFGPENGMIVDGNVGIGITEPEAKLDVDGDIKVSGQNNGIILNSADGKQWKLTVNENGELEINEVVAVEKIQPEGQLEIAPNPVSSEIKIELKESIITYPVKAEVYDLKGSLITLNPFNSATININVSNLQSGTYLLKIKDASGKFNKSGKFIKQ